MKQTCVKVKRLPVLVALSLAIIMFACAWLVGFVAIAHADGTSFARDWSETVSVSNSSFSETGSGEPATPSNWTETKLNTNSYAKSGVVNTSEYSGLKADTKDKYGLANDFVTNPQDGDYTDKDNKVLFINATSSSAYGYSSSDVTFEKSAYYRISVYVKTDITAGSGASVTVSGLKDENVGIVGIKTVRKWERYSLYLATSSLKSSTGKIVLGLGSDKASDTCIGAVLFDQLKVERISAHKFFSEVASSKAVEDANTVNLNGSLNAKISLDESNKAIFTDPAKDFKAVATDNTATTVDIKKNDGFGGYKYGFDGAIYPAFDGKTSSVILLSTPVDEKDGKYEHKDGYASVTAKTELDVKRSAYYRLSGWYYAQNQGAPSVKLAYKLGVENGKTDEKTFSLSATTSSKDHNGWQEFAIFVKGSDLADVKLTLSLMMGTKDSKVKGAVLFEELRMMQITPATYDELSSSATGTLTIDSETSIGITNGSFNATGSYDSLDDLENGKPLAPKSWTKTVSEGKPENVVSGLVDYSTINYPSTVYSKIGGNVLKIEAKKAAAVSYTSETFTIAADSYNLLSVDVVVDENDSRSDRGAVINVKRDDKTIGSIEKIRKSGRYNLYIKGGSAASTLSLELGLGKSGKPATGTVYFTRAGLLTASGTVVAASPEEVLTFAATADEFNKIDENYNIQRLNESVNVTNATVSLVAADMSQFDSYSDSDLKTPYNWSLGNPNGSNDVVYGIFDSKNRGISTTKESNLPDTFKPYSDAYPYALVLRNGDKAYSYLTLDNAYTLAADSFYKLTLAVKTYGVKSDKGGAFVSIGDDHRFDFTSTVGLIDGLSGDVDDYEERYKDYENYDEYVFYIKTSSSETTSDIKIGLGGDKYSERASGTLVLGYINLEKIEGVDYEEATSKLKENENTINAFTKRADFSTASEEEEKPSDKTQKGEIAWWLIPSILLGVAVVIAVVGTFIRKKIEKRPKKPVNPSTRSSYDRRNLTLPEGENDDNAVGEDTSASDEVTDETMTETENNNGATGEENAEATDEAPEVEATETPAETIEEAPAEAPTEAVTEEVTETPTEETPAEQPTEENK